MAKRKQPAKKNGRGRKKVENVPKRKLEIEEKSTTDSNKSDETVETSRSESTASSVTVLLTVSDILLSDGNIPQDTSPNEFMEQIVNSIVEKIGFDNPKVIEIYKKLLRSIPLATRKSEVSAFVAMLTCQKSGVLSLVGEILESLIRSLDANIMEPMQDSDMIFLLEHDFPLDLIPLFEKFSEANELAKKRLSYVSKIDYDKLDKVMQRPIGFADVEDLLLNPGKIDKSSRPNIEQVKLLLKQLFHNHRSLIQNHARNICLIVDSVEYCPPNAISTIEVIVPHCAERIRSGAKGLSTYVLSLTLLRNLDLTGRGIPRKLLKILAILCELQTCSIRIYKDVLKVFAEIYMNSICSDDHEIIQKFIFDHSIYLAGCTDIVESQIELLNFFEDLIKNCALELTRDICGSLINKAGAFLIVNRVCALMLSHDEICQDERIQDLVKLKIKQRNLRKAELKIEYEAVYRYLRHENSTRSALSV